MKWGMKTLSFTYDYFLMPPMIKGFHSVGNIDLRQTHYSVEFSKRYGLYYVYQCDKISDLMIYEIKLNNRER